MEEEEKVDPLLDASFLAGEGFAPDSAPPDESDTASSVTFWHKQVQDDGRQLVIAEDFNQKVPVNQKAPDQQVDWTSTSFKAAFQKLASHDTTVTLLTSRAPLEDMGDTCHVVMAAHITPTLNEEPPSIRMQATVGCEENALSSSTYDAAQRSLWATQKAFAGLVAHLWNTELQPDDVQVVYRPHSTMQDCFRCLVAEGLPEVEEKSELQASDDDESGSSHNNPDIPVTTVDNTTNPPSPPQPDDAKHGPDDRSSPASSASSRYWAAILAGAVLGIAVLTVVVALCINPAVGLGAALVSHLGSNLCNALLAVGSASSLGLILYGTGGLSRPAAPAKPNM